MEDETATRFLLGEREVSHRRSRDGRSPSEEAVAPGQGERKSD